MIVLKLSAVIGVVTLALIWMAGPSAMAYDYGEVILQFNANNDNWGGGGITWLDGYLWETARKSDRLWKRNPANGGTLETYTGLPYLGVSVSYDSKNGWFWVSDPYDPPHSGAYNWDLGAYALPASGNTMVFQRAFEPGQYESDTFYDASLDRIWI